MQESYRSREHANVLVSMAGEGAVLLDEKGTGHMSEAPKGKVRNAVGAGDSMVAGFVAGYQESGDYEYAFHMGLSAEPVPFRESGNSRRSKEFI